MMRGLRLLHKLIHAVTVTHGLAIAHRNGVRDRIVHCSKGHAGGVAFNWQRQHDAMRVASGANQRAHCCYYC